MARNYRLGIIEALGGRCGWPGCDVDDPDMLHVEHKYGNGAEERLQFGGGGKRYFYQNGNRTTISRTYYKHIFYNLSTGNYQLLCANHHAKKTAIERQVKKVGMYIWHSPELAA